MRQNLRQNWFLATVLGVSVMAAAQQAPKVVNAQFHTEQAGGALSATVGRFQHENGPLWLGYEVAALTGSHFSSCSGDTRSGMDDGCCGVYQLEGSENVYRSSSAENAPVTKIDVLIRIDHGAIDRFRFVGTGCGLDAGGLSFTWLTGIGAEESVAWLASLVTGENNKRLTDQALATIAMHESGKATTVLAGFASSSNPMWLREKAAFWLGAERGHDGLLALEKLTSDGDPEFRNKLAFDLSVNHDPAAIDDMIRMAKSDSDTRVREEAIFWVGQKAGAKAIGTLKDAVANDPEVAVKKKAVFALSQLPKDQAVPELLQVAQTNSNPAVRKEAIFWLGQTHDPRALAYFEKILEH
ncbi:HEAT repeat domain-containing protein [Terracidiphilus gabretensis]|uniref:HEAT repeat domain-containing protein n=1 Tax=Terracidiphilus gabretensis TaxID=1577687 RepID=UPI00071B7102|nr:HEAT repeat domain-containing protein [Terracidiphilus gabretensis]